MLGCVCGFFMGVTVAGRRRRPTCRELMRDPDRQPGGKPELSVTWLESPVMRGNGTGGPTTPRPDIIPKPQPSGGRLIETRFWRLRINSSRPGAKPQFPPPQIIREDFLP